MNFFDIFINKQAHYMTVTSYIKLIFFLFFFFNGPGVMASYSDHAICPIYFYTSCSHINLLVMYIYTDYKLLSNPLFLFYLSFRFNI